MSAIRMLSVKLFEPTTTVPALAWSFVNGLSDVEDEEHPASSAAVAASATAAAPGSCLLDVLLFAVEVTIPVPGRWVGQDVAETVRDAGTALHRSKPAPSRSVKCIPVTDRPRSRAG
jgi:hypothetical protein